MIWGVIFIGVIAYEFLTGESWDSSTLLFIMRTLVLYWFASIILGPVIKNAVISALREIDKEKVKNI
jgi:hypothetical protein